METLHAFRKGLGMVLVVVLAGLICVPAVAQQTFSVGLRAGMNAASFYGDDVDEVNVRGHLTGGVFATYRLTDFLAIQPEVLFTEKGANVIGTGMSQPDEMTYTFGYLEIPLLAKLYMPASTTVQPNVFLGPALDIKLYNEEDGKNVEHQVKGTDYGVVAGVGLDYVLQGFQARQRRISLDARYMLGLNDIFDMPGDPQVRNSTLMFTLGFSL